TEGWPYPVSSTVFPTALSPKRPPWHAGHQEGSESGSSWHPGGTGPQFHRWRSGEFFDHDRAMVATPRDLFREHHALLKRMRLIGNTPHAAIWHRAAAARPVFAASRVDRKRNRIQSRQLRPKWLLVVEIGFDDPAVVIARKYQREIRFDPVV